MTSISDNFVRANGALGANWATVVPNKAEFTGWGGTPQGNVLISSNGVGPDATNGLDCACLWAGGQTFGNDQWATAAIKTVAAANAVLAITACTVSGGNITFTYTVSSGSVASYISEGHLYVFVSGMTNSFNNGGYLSTTFGAGTFTAAVNAGNANEAGSSGTGTVPGDCGCGVAVRMSGTSAATLNGYFFHVGTNSFNGDITDAGRKAYYELWKIVNGVGTQLIGDDAQTTLSRTTPTVASTIGISAIGSQITAYYNGIVLTGGDPATNGGVYQITDTSIAGGGVPAITTFAVSGSSEYHWSLWSSGNTQFGGNNGTTINTFQAGDVGTQAQLATDSFAYSNGDLHTANAHWVYQGTSQFQVATNKVYKGAAGQALSLAYRDDISPNADQYSQVTAVVTGTTGTQNTGPAVRIATGATTCYCIQYGNNAIILAKIIAGTLTAIANDSSHPPVTGDIIALSVVGSFLYVTKNGVIVISATNTEIASGSVGLFGAGNATVNGFSAWSGGNISTVTTAVGNAGSLSLRRRNRDAI